MSDNPFSHIVKEVIHNPGSIAHILGDELHHQQHRQPGNHRTEKAPLPTHLNSDTSGLYPAADGNKNAKGNKGQRNDANNETNKPGDSKSAPLAKTPEQLAEAKELATKLGQMQPKEMIETVNGKMKLATSKDFDAMREAFKQLPEDKLKAAYDTLTPEQKEANNALRTISTMPDYVKKQFCTDEKGQASDDVGAHLTKDGIKKALEDPELRNTLTEKEVGALQYLSKHWNEYKEEAGKDGKRFVPLASVEKEEGGPGSILVFDQINKLPSVANSQMKGMREQIWAQQHPETKR